MATSRPCFVHVGLPKTGTSYLQSVLERSRGALADQGVTVLPISTTAFTVMLDLRGQLRRDLDPPEAFEALDRLAEDAASAPGERALMTQELLSLCSTAQATRLVESLPGHEVHLVVTVRDLATQLPSLWQQHMKARGVTPFAAFVDRVTSGGSGDDAAGFDLLGVLEQWRGVVPPERVHVVTFPRPGAAPTLLLERFCQVIGVDPDPLDTSRSRSNPSIGMVQAELLRRVNLALGSRLPHPRAGYRGPGKKFLAETILIKQEGRPPRLPVRTRAWVEERSQALVEALRSGGYDVVGDLDELLPDDSAFDDQLDEVTDAELVDAATQALAEVLVDRHEGKAKRMELRRTVADQRRRIKELEAGSGGASPRAVVGRVRRALRRDPSDD